MRKCQKCEKLIDIGIVKDKWCHKCRKKYYNEWYSNPKNQRKRISDRSKRYLYLQNKEKNQARNYFKSAEVKERHREARRIYRHRHPEKEKARKILYYEILKGNITKGNCSYIDGRCEGPIQAFIIDYSKPLNVKWFCRKHHALCQRVYKFLGNKGRQIVRYKA